MDRFNAACLKLVVSLVFALILVACSRAPVAAAPVVQASAPAQSAPTTPPMSTTPTPATPAPAPAGEPLAFKACAAQRPQACTRDYNPVCATRDTGIRCITTPCPSTEQKTYSNACSACADPKVSGSTRGACPGG